MTRHRSPSRPCCVSRGTSHGRPRHSIQDWWERCWGHRGDFPRPRPACGARGAGSTGLLRARGRAARVCRSTSCPTFWTSRELSRARVCLSRNPQCPLPLPVPPGAGPSPASPAERVAGMEHPHGVHFLPLPHGGSETTHAGLHAGLQGVPPRGGGALTPALRSRTPTRPSSRQTWTGTASSACRTCTGCCSACCST